MTESPAVDVDAVAARPKDLRFWVMLMALCLAVFLSSLEFTGVSTALPTIAADLHAADFLWAGSAYPLASSAILPMTGGLAQNFGRRPSFFGSILLFAIGSAICGAARNMNMLVGGRVVQGLGGGGILSLSMIVIGDMVTLQERGLYAGGFFGLVSSVAAIIAPVVGGSLATIGQWRWLFYFNLPLCALSAAFAIVLSDLPTPPGTFREKLSQMDWTGNFLVITSTCSVTIALTFGGINFPWSSAHILSPLLIGLVGMVLFIIYEAIWASYPLVPFSILANRTSFSGYLQTFLLPVATLALTYFIPVYFQVCKDANAVSSGVRILGLCAIAPAIVIGGVSVKIWKCYRPQMWVAWVLQIVGVALMTTVKADTPNAMTVGFCVLFGVGAGINYGVAVYPIQAPLPVTQNGHSLAFLVFLRSFAGVWGITLGGAILQNELLRHLPGEFLDQFPQGVAIVYSAIPQIHDLPQPLKDDVREAFAESLSVVWKVVAGVCGAGLVSSLLMRGLPLHAATDEAWAPKK